MEMYQVVDLETWQVIARGFRTKAAAIRWAEENDCGWYMYTIHAYWAEVDFT